mmetsp:Transcript_896/g.1626  ORF Transcript_896/g.1626 Transcript_896/m.1626 type:complete len:219 (+) Transcript_896:329-985(+)
MEWAILGDFQRCSSNWTNVSLSEAQLRRCAIVRRMVLLGSNLFHCWITWCHSFGYPLGACQFGANPLHDHLGVGHCSKSPNESRHVGKPRQGPKVGSYWHGKRYSIWNHCVFVVLCLQGPHRPTVYYKRGGDSGMPRNLVGCLYNDHPTIHLCDQHWDNEKSWNAMADGWFCFSGSVVLRPSHLSSCGSDWWGYSHLEMPSVLLFCTECSHYDLLYHC